MQGNDEAELDASASRTLLQLPDELLVLIARFLTPDLTAQPLTYDSAIKPDRMGEAEFLDRLFPAVKHSPPGTMTDLLRLSAVNSKLRDTFAPIFWKHVTIPWGIGASALDMLRPNPNPLVSSLWYHYDDQYSPAWDLLDELQRLCPSAHFCSIEWTYHRFLSGGTPEARMKMFSLDLIINSDNDECFEWASMPQDDTRLYDPGLDNRVYVPMATVTMPKAVATKPRLPPAVVKRFEWTLTIEAVQASAHLPCQGWILALAASQRGTLVDWQSSTAYSLEEIMSGLARDLDAITQLSDEVKLQRLSINLTLIHPSEPTRMAISESDGGIPKILRECNRVLIAIDTDEESSEGVLLDLQRFGDSESIAKTNSDEEDEDFLGDEDDLF